MNFWGDRNTRYRKTIAHSLCHGINIRTYTGVVVRIKFAASAITALHRIGDIHRIVLIAEAAYFLQERIGCNIYTPNTLYAFYYYG